MWFFHNPGLLGINARNLLYIKAYNQKKAVLMADSKLKTKHFLAARGIPTAKLYASISEKKELKNFNWNALPQSFVVKPDSGYGGEGIIIIKDRKGKKFIKSNDESISQETLKDHIEDILDSRYSMNEISDIALFEQILIAPEPFASIAYKGLPDIRVIVHNLIPVMAMLRLPTEKSDGKANVHLGGIAAGIDISKGEITYTTQYGKRISEVPGYGDITGLKIPHWEKILLIASRVQQISNLGFAAIDISLDKTSGPVLLEINARAGLSVQIANMAPLHRRLERIEGIKVQTPEKGVRIALDLFGQRAERPTEQKEKPIIGVNDTIEIIGEKGKQKVNARVDFSKEKTMVDQHLARLLGIEPDTKCKLNIKTQRIVTVVDIGDLGEDTPVQLGMRDLKDILIDPNKKTILRNAVKIPKISWPSIFTEKPSKNTKSLALESSLMDIDKQIHLLHYLKPINLEEEEKQILADTNYNPQFIYKPLNFNAEEFITTIQNMAFPDSIIGILWKKKADEIIRKINLLQARGTDQFVEKSIELYGAPDPLLVEEAEAFVKTMPTTFPEEGPMINALQAKAKFEEILAKYGLKQWSVSIQKELISDVIAGKEKNISIREDATFSSQRLKGTIAHEIETHVLTFVNGKTQPYKIFQRGLADYLFTEEGLAIYNQNNVQSHPIPKTYWPASSTIGVDKALKGSFVETVNALISLGFNRARAQRVALKTKRGLIDTSKPGGFTRELVYFKGNKMILAFIEKGGDLRDLYHGKINLNDLYLIKKIPELKPPWLLPFYLQEKED